MCDERELGLEGLEALLAGGVELRAAAAELIQRPLQERASVGESRLASGLLESARRAAYSPASSGMPAWKALTSGFTLL